jgi:hypothetical protein
MNAPVIDTTTAAPTSWVLDFMSCPPPLNAEGRAGWAEVTALQCHVITARLMSENRRLRTERTPFCDKCGAQPCVNPSFCAACQKADAEARTQRERDKTARLRSLMSDSVSLDRAWAELNNNRPTPLVIVEAIKVAVRARGIAALQEPATRARLRSCDVAAAAEFDRWLSNFKQGISR